MGTLQCSIFCDEFSALLMVFRSVLNQDLTDLRGDVHYTVLLLVGKSIPYCC